MAADEIKIELDDDFSEQAKRIIAQNDRLQKSLSTLAPNPTGINSFTNNLGKLANVSANTAEKPTSAFAKFSAKLKENLSNADSSLAGFVNSSKANLSSLASSAVSAASVITLAGAGIGVAFGVKAGALADDVADLSEALAMFTGKADAGDRLRAISREFSTNITETQKTFIDFASSNIEGDKAEEIFGRLQDLAASGLDKSRVESLSSAFKKINADNKLDPGDLKALQSGGVNKPDFFAALAKNSGKSLAEVKQLVEAGSIKADEATRAALDVIKKNTGDQAAGALAKSDLGGTLAGAAQTLASSFEQFQLNFGNQLLAQLQPLLPLIQQLGAALGGVEGEGLAKSLGEGVGQAIAFVVDHIEDFKAAFQSVWEGVKAGFGILSSLFKTLFGGGENATAGETIRAIGQSLGTLLKYAVPVIAVLPAIAAVVSAISTVISVIGGVISVASTVFSVISTIIGAIGPIVAAITGFVSTVAGVVGPVLGAIGAVIGAIGAAPILIGAALVAVGVLIYTFRDEIWAVLTAVGQFIWSTLQTIAGYFTSIFTSISTTIQNGINAALTFVTETIPNLAKAIIDGLVNGISAGIGQVVDKIKGLATAGLDAFKSVFGIHSPSVEMSANADHITNGLTNQLDKRSGDVESSMADTFAVPAPESLGLAIPANTAAPAGTTPQVAPAGDAAGGKSGAGAVGINATINVVVEGAAEPVQTGHAVAGAVTRAVQNSFDIPFG